MAKKKRTGLDALQEYEAGSGYAASSATSYGQTQTQGKTTTFKRSGLDALREYEQYGNPGGVQDTAFDPNYRSRNYQTPGQSAAFEAYRNAVNAAQKTRNGAPVSGKVSEQEYSRSSGMQKQYGTYQNYLRGVEAAQGLKLGTLALQGQSALLAGRFAPATQKTKEDVDTLNRRIRAEKTVQHDQVQGMRRTSKELGKQIDALEKAHAEQTAEKEQSANFFTDLGRAQDTTLPYGLGNVKNDETLQEIDALKERKAAVDSQAVLPRAQEALRTLSEEEQNLLRQYRGREVNREGVPDLSRDAAKAALKGKGYSDERLKQLAEFQNVLDDYEEAQKLDALAQKMGGGNLVGKAAATVFSAAIAPAKALGNVESLRGVLPSWAGGYQNEDMPTNIYSPAYAATRLSSGIRQSVMQGMDQTGQFLYQAGTSALDSAVNMAVSTGLVGTVGGAAGAGAQDAIAETMNWVMGSQVAADSVYEGIQSGKSNADALVDGIVEGAIEGITEKYSVGDIIENMLSGKAVWKKALRSFASEGAEEIASNWLNRAYDVVAKHDRGEVMSAYAAYLADGKTPAQALAAMVGDFAKEDSLSFLAGGLSGLAMSGTYAGVNRVILEANVTQTARAVIEAGEVQDVIDYGMAQEEGTKAHQLAEELQQTVDDGGEVTQKAVENTLREVAKEQQAAVDEGQEPRVPETLTRLEQLQEQARQEQAQAEADEKTFQIYKSAAETAQENQRLAQQYQQEQEQSRAQQSVQAVQQAQQAAQQQYDQDSLLAPIPGTENMGELDPVQYARQQTADAEQALDEAALQQEEQYLQDQARRAGYDEQTASYFLNGNTTGMPAEQYAQSFQKVYEQGRLGASEQRAMRYAEGMNQDVAAAAYRAGIAAGQKNVQAEMAQKKSKVKPTTPKTRTAEQALQDAKNLRDSGASAKQVLNETGWLPLSADTYKNPKTGEQVHYDGGKVTSYNRKGANNGSIEVTDEGQVGQAGQRAEGQAGGVRQSTAQRQRADAGRKRAQGARDLAKAWDEVTLSELGLGEGNTQTVRVMPQGQEAGSQDIKDAVKFFRSMGVQDARFFTGQLTQEIGGQTFYADAAVTEDGSVLIRADSEEYSAFELAKHEGYHLLAKRWPEMAAKIQKRLLSEGKITKEMIESYVDAYAGIYGDDTDAYVEEIVADTYAGMNRTDFGTNKLRADVKVEVGQWQKKSGSARAPPVKMSASKAEKYDFTKPFAEQVDDWKAGKIEKNDTLVVGPTPEVFQKVGFNALPVTINQTHVDYALNGTKNEEHHIGEPMLKQLPRAMKTPVAIIASETQSGTSVVALLPFIKDAKTVIIPVYVDGYGRQNSVVIDSNAVTSIYGRKNAVTGLLTNAIEKSNNGETTLFYVDKVKAAALYQVARVTMPKMPDTDNGFVASIRDEGSTVKPKLKNVTQSQQFKRWFGDWQNHPESASKVVNADGTPKVVYHGTSEQNGSFTVFDESKAVKRGGLGFKALGKGNYFTATPLTGNERYGSRVIEAYLNIRNPLVVEAGATFRDTAAEIIGESAHEMSYDELQAEMRERGYDGVIQRNKAGDVNIAVAFDSNQIKSATDNIGTFDKANPDIRYSSQEGRYRDLMGEKPAQYTRRAENFLLAKIAGSFGVSSEAKRETLQPFTEQIVRKFLQTGELDNKLVDDLVDAAAEVSMEENQSYYEEYKGILKFIENQKISIPAQDKADVRNWNQFRQQAAKNLNITDDGLPVRDVYWTLHKKAPQLFPASNKTAGAQIMQIYEVAEGIRQTREWVEGFKGVDAAEVSKVKQDVFEARATNARLDWAKNDARNAVKEMAASVRITQRYLEAQNEAKEKLTIPQSAEETEQLWKQLKDARKVVAKAQGKTLLTEADQRIVGQLLRGETDPVYAAKLKNGAQILKVYEAKADYDMLAMKLKAWNAQRKQGLRDFAEQALDAADAAKWVDKNMGIRYQRETMERNIRDIARKGKISDEKTNEFINKYFWPVHKNESERKNYLVEQQNKIRALNLSRKVEKGNLVSESYAVQWLGEAEFNRDYLKEHPQAGQRAGMMFEEWNAAIQKFEKQNPNLDLGKVRAAVKVFHEVYDKLFEDMNQVRIRNGYEPVNYLQGYFPHFQENDAGGDILQKFARAVGINGDVAPLPTTINGLTAIFKPGIRYMANIQHRLGYATAYDALQGFDRYIEVATDVIFHTDDIQRLRALETQIRYRASDEGIKRRIDAISADQTLSPDEADSRIRTLTADGRYGLSNLANELNEYTNLLAGKKSRLDREWERALGRGFYNVMKKFSSRVGANMVAGNVGSALTNFVPIVQAAAQTGWGNMLNGMRATLKNYWTADGLSAASTFINNRTGYGQLAETTMDKVAEKAGILMDVVDGISTGSVVRARYYQNLRRGMSEMNAMQEADQFAASVMADRSKGSMPTIYEARNPWVKLFTQFQLEVNNTLSWVFKDMVREERKKSVAAMAKALFSWMLGSWVLNEFHEALTGRRMGQDPFDIVNDTVGDITGYQLPNAVDALISGEWNFTTQQEDAYGVAANLTQNLLGELPFTQVLTMLGLEVDNGRIAVASALPDVGAIFKAATNKDIAPEKRAYTIRRELAKPAYYLAPPFGGGQARKTLQGMEAAAKGGSYSVDNEGHDLLQYPVYNDNTKDAIKSWTQAILFGKTATEEAQSWVESGFKSLSAKETAAYQGMTEGGEDQRETYAFIQAARKLEKNYDKMMLLKAYDISDAAKAEYYYQVLAGDTQKAEMEPMRTQERIDYMNEKIQDAEDARQKQDLKDAVAAGTVTQEKAIQRILANDYAEDENKAYWLYKEWTGGKDYTKFGQLLQVVESGGDVGKTAQEYLSHGVEKGDIGNAITKAYKAQYIAASPAERKKLKEKLLAAYVAAGFNRADKSRDIDKWLKDSK